MFQMATASPYAVRQEYDLLAELGDCHLEASWLCLDASSSTPLTTAAGLPGTMLPSESNEYPDKESPMLSSRRPVMLISSAPWSTTEWWPHLTEVNFAIPPPGSHAHPNFAVHLGSRPAISAPMFLASDLRGVSAVSSGVRSEDSQPSDPPLRSFEHHAARCSEDPFPRNGRRHARLYALPAPHGIAPY